MINIFERNLTLKLISIVFAIILWLYATGLKNPERPKVIPDIPIVTQNEYALTQRELIIVDEYIKDISIRVRGRDSELRKIDNEALKAIVDLSQIEEPGKQKVAVKLEGVPSGVKVEKNDEVILNIDRIVSWDVPLQVKLSGKTKEGYQLHGPEVNPKIVTLRGPESLVKKIAYGVVFLDIGEGLTETVEQSAMVRYYQIVAGKENEIKSKLIEMTNGAVAVKIPVYPEKRLQVDASSAVTGSPAEGYEITEVSVYPKEILVNGEEDVLSQVETLLTEPVDIQGAASTVNRNVNILPYHGVYINPGQPDKVVVVVRIQEKVIEKSFTVTNIQASNLADGRTATLYENEVMVTLRGLYSTISNVSLESIQAFVDLTNAPRGTQEYSVQIIVPKGTELVEVEPASISVRIR